MTVEWLSDLEESNAPRVRLPENNQATYWMDFSYWEGLPSDRDFFVLPHQCEGWVTLVADGYGARGSYGSGSVFIEAIQLPALKER